jgi:membrane protease YdiL (CAAX protease family)
LGLTAGPAVPAFTLLVLGSVWWTFALYHGVVCLLLPLTHALLVRRVGFREHLRDIGLVPLRLHPGSLFGLALALATVAGLSLGRAVLLTSRIDLVLASWQAPPERIPLLLTCMLAGNGAAEELYWRGWLHRRLEHWPRRAAAIALAAAAYASYHAVTIGAFVADPLLIVALLAVVFGAGLFFGWLRERWSSVWPPLLAHTGATAGYVLAYWHMLTR